MRTLASRRGAVARLAGLLALFPLAATAGDALPAALGDVALHMGPVSVREGQLVVVAATNVGRDGLSVRAALLDEDGGTLVDEPLEIGPGESRTIRWTAEARGLVRGLVSGPAGQPAPAVSLYVYDAGRGGFASPTLEVPTGTGQSITTATAAYAPIMIAAKTVLGNVGSFATTFRVSFRDDAGRLLLARSLILAPGQSGSVTLPPPLPNGARGEVAAPGGAAYLFSMELLDAEGRTTAVLQRASR